MSEEQFKIFSLPTLASTGKYKVSAVTPISAHSMAKVTANEGVLVRKTRATSFESLGVSPCRGMSPF